MIRSTQVETATVYCNKVPCGELRRTPKGSAFEYDPDYLSNPAKPLGGIAIHLPYGQKTVRTPGSRLHPFFEGLLPEGLRLEALVGKANTSRDDLFSILIEAGPDCVGDIYALPKGDQSDRDVVRLDIRKLAGEGFDELEESYLGGARDASIPGVQQKLSAGLINLPLPSGKDFGPAILKLSPKQYPLLVENESFFMQTAASCGLAVPKTKIVSDKRGRTGLLVWRFDRSVDRGLNTIERLHQEDACQFTNRYPADKYRLTMQEIARAIQEYCDGAVAMYSLCKLYIYCYAIGNADLHAKNISTLRRKPKGPTTMSPAYDLVCTAAYAELETRMALPMNGKDDNFNRSDFVRFFNQYGLKDLVVHNVVDEIVAGLQSAVSDISKIGFGEETERRVKGLISKRLVKLGGY